MHARNDPPSLADRPWRSLPPEIADTFRPHVPELAAEIVDAIRATVPAYARPLEGAFGQAIREGSERALTEFLDEVAGARGERAPGVRDPYVELGRGEVRAGRTIEALLAAYRVGARVAWRRTAVWGREAGFDPETLTLLGEAFFAYIDELSARSAHGFADERSHLAGEAASRRRRLLALLLQAPPAEPATVEAAAREAGWAPPATLAALVWRDESDQPVARRLPFGTLAAQLDDGLVWALVPDAGAPGRPAELRRALGRRRGALGPTVPWPEAWLSARRALAAHRLAAAGIVDGQLVVADEHLAELIVHGDPGLARDLAERRLAPLAGRPPGGRARLLATLAAWLDHQGSVARVAEQLHIHPQTVRYRLAQLRELFGDALDDPAARFELALAVRAVPAGEEAS